MDKNEPSLTLVASRFSVSCIELDKLNIVDQNHIVWTISTWAKNEMARLLPLTLADRSRQQS